MLVAATPELVREFDRLSGTQIGRMGTRSPVVAMVDEATGFEADQLRQFVQFVFRYVYVPLLGRPMSCLSDCLDEEDLKWYLIGTYGMDHLPSLAELRATSKPLDWDQ